MIKKKDSRLNPRYELTASLWWVSQRRDGHCLFCWCLLWQATSHVALAYSNLPRSSHWSWVSNSSTSMSRITGQWCGVLPWAAEMFSFIDLLFFVWALLFSLILGSHHLAQLRNISSLTGPSFSVTWGCAPLYCRLSTGVGSLFNCQFFCSGMFISLHFHLHNQ